MKIKIGKILKQNCINIIINFIPIILVSIILCGQIYAKWERTNLPGAVKVNTIVMRDSSIFAGTNGDGIFVSTNNGENWKSINEGLQSKVVHTILINGKNLPAGKARIFAGTETGVSVSTDNGESWRSINSGLSGLGVWSLAVSADSAGYTTIFAGAWSGVYSSTDWGENWEVTSLSSTKMPVHTIIILNRYIFAATVAEGLFISHDNGLTWTNTNIIYKEKGSNFETIAPFYSITKLVGPFTHSIIVGSMGGFYYMDYSSSYFDNEALNNWSVAILSFADRSDTLFFPQYGYFFWIYHDFLGWKFGPLNIPNLENMDIYSLVLNNEYIFAGTEEGLWRLRYPIPGSITGVESSQEVPAGFVLEQNYPNPFNPMTVITYRLPVTGNTTLKVYDVLGRPVATLVNEHQAAGSHSVKFYAGGLPSGVYFYKLQAGSFVRTKKMILLQ
ncbi:MAG: T9SS type A sorting domain-containing protein [Ignavibacteriaceae bacterium]